MTEFDDCNDQREGEGCVVVFLPRVRNPSKCTLDRHSIPTGREWIHCMRNLAACDASFRRAGSIRQPMIERLISAVISSPSEERTDYTYARTISYLPPDLASPTADRQKPNMKRNAIRKQSIYSAATSTSHYGGGSQSEDEAILDMQRQRTIPVSSKNYEDIYQLCSQDASISNYSRTGGTGQPSSTGWIRRAFNIIKWLLLPGCLAMVVLTLAMFYRLDGKESILQKVIQDRLGNVPTSHETEGHDFNRLRIEVEQLTKRLDQLTFKHYKPLTTTEKKDQCCLDVIRTYDNDKTGILDFAHASMGGQIYSVGCTKAYKAHMFSRSSIDPNIILRSNIMPGECWPFKGSNGSIVIRLAHTINPMAITYEHIDQTISLYGDNAPFTFTITAWNFDSGANTKFDLGTFHFLWNETKIKTFYFRNVSPDAYVNTFDIGIRENWGNKEQTCLYRIRIHGQM